ncbi:MAG TPA: CPBP family intramembrane glutamic endopeptidase [Rhodanobacter sp.]
MYTDFLPLPPSIQPTLIERQPVARTPGLWAALGLLVLYFALQAGSGMLIALVMGLATGFMHASQGAVQVGFQVRAMLAQPDTQAVIVMLTLGMAAAVTLLLARRRWPGLWSLALPPGFGFTLPGRPLFFALAILVGLAAPLLGGLLTQVLSHGQRLGQDIQQLGSDTSPELRILLVLVVTALGPVVEELLFRGVLLSALLQRCRVGWAVGISSLLFALVHLPGLHWQWYALPDLALLALALSWLRLRAGSIWPAVLAHGVNNLLAVAAWFVAVHLPS